MALRLCHYRTDFTLRFNGSTRQGSLKQTWTTSCVISWLLATRMSSRNQVQVPLWELLSTNDERCAFRRCIVELMPASSFSNPSAEYPITSPIDKSRAGANYSAPCVPNHTHLSQTHGLFKMGGEDRQTETTRQWGSIFGKWGTDLHSNHPLKLTNSFQWAKSNCSRRQKDLSQMKTKWCQDESLHQKNRNRLVVNLQGQVEASTLWSGMIFPTWIL